MICKPKTVNCIPMYKTGTRTLADITSVGWHWRLGEPCNWSRTRRSRPRAPQSLNLPRTTNFIFHSANLFPNAPIFASSTPTRPCYFIFHLIRANLCIKIPPPHISPDCQNMTVSIYFYIRT